MSVGLRTDEQLFAIFCVAAGAINNRIGLKWGLVIGYVKYSLN